MSEMMDTTGAPDDGRGALRDRVFTPTVPAALEARITRSLYAAGYLEAASAWRRRPWTRILLAAALIVFTFIAGFATAARRVVGERQVAIERRAPRFVLLLYASADSGERVDDVAEHRRWVADLSRTGHTVTGEKLAPNEVDLTPLGRTAATDEQLEGFFIVTAATEADAVSLARSLPHYKHGGRVVVRPVEPT